LDLAFVSMDGQAAGRFSRRYWGYEEDWVILEVIVRKEVHHLFQGGVLIVPIQRYWFG
jgi:hypothetical protein